MGRIEIKVEISIIVPVYNVEQYLKDCLDSIFVQSFTKFEVICVEDCSQDHSLEIAKEYERKYDNFLLIKNSQNRGLSFSRNKGLKYAKGKYILFVDSDDMIKSNTLEELYQQAEGKKLDILYFNKQIIYEESWNGEKEKESKRKFGDEDILEGKEMFVQFLLNKSLKSMNAYTQFFLREFLLKNKLLFYEGIVHEDFLFYFQCSMMAKRVGNVDKELYIYRKRENSITENVTILHKQSIFITLIEVLNYWKNNEFTELENRAIREFCEVIYRSCKKYYDESKFKDKLNFGGPSDSFLYDKIMNRSVSFSEQELLRMQMEDQVWIYGAGKVACETVVYLEKYNINIKGCLVTNKNENNSHFFGWNIWQLDEAPITLDTLIILAAAQPNKIKMQNILKYRNFNNVINAIK